MAAEPGLFESWWRMRKERKARQPMTTEMPPDIAAEITADAAGEHDPQPARGRSESLREFLQRTPHRYERDWNSDRLCVCGFGTHDIHGGAELLDTRAYVAARLEKIRAGWPIPVPAPEGAAEDIPRETIAAEPAQPPGAASVYLVARAEGGVIIDTTHTTAMDLETARREAKAHGVSSVREWFPVELRRVSGG